MCTPFYFRRIRTEKRLALQRDIELHSYTEQPVKVLATEKFAVVGRPTKGMKQEMEEEDTIVKKMKKRKKGHVSLPEETNGSLNAETQTVVKTEQKKTKKVKVSETEENVGGEIEKTKKRKKRKIDMIDTNNTDVMNGKDVEVSKKRKKKADNENEVENLVNEVKKKKKVKDTKHPTKEEEEEQSVKAKNKQKKAKKSKKCVLVEITKETKVLIKQKNTKESIQAMEGLTDTKIKKKANLCDNELRSKTPDIEVQEVKKKKKKKINASVVNEVNVTKIEVESFENILKLETQKTEMKVAKKKKKKEAKEEEEATENIAKNKKTKMANKSKVSDDKILSKKKKKSIMLEIEERETEQKKKVKQKKYQKGSVEAAEVEKIKKKKRKKAKEPPVTSEDAEDQHQIVGNHVTLAEDTPSKKRKKKTRPLAEIENASNVEVGTKKIKEEEKDPQEESQLDVVFLSAKTGNTDEIHINQERRQALQMEINQASQPSKPEGLGQWGTAQFDSSEQQQKFLRLMGGFKKGFQPAASSTGVANMALGKDAQQQLQEGLLGDFERAHSRRKDFSNRAAGLGFSALSNKKFSIDANACRSVRFDD